MTAKPLWIIVPAAGSGRRMQVDMPKQYLRLAGRSMLDWTLSAWLNVPGVQRLMVCVAASDQQFAQQTLAAHPRVQRVTGGAERALSVMAGLKALSGQAGAADAVLVHDAARPLVAAADIAAVVAAIHSHPLRAAALAQPVADTLLRADADECVQDALDRRALWQAQTPQGAPFATLRAALEQALKSATLPTDEASALHAAGVPVQLVPASAPNFKLTTPADLQLADVLLRQRGK